MSFSGALLLHKPVGPTSFEMVEHFKRKLRQIDPASGKQIKLGHGGTLDPFAEGLLVILTGAGVKLSRYFLESEKFYEAEMVWGIKTPSGDLTLPVLETCPRIPTEAQVVTEAASKLFSVPYLQTPPMYSAKKKDGRPLYELARQGIEIERTPKLCKIKNFVVLEHTSPVTRFQVQCSSGTYIRTLAEDLAHSIQSLAALRTLKRLGSGIFELKHAVPLVQLDADFLNASQSNEPLSLLFKKWQDNGAWVPIDQMLRGFVQLEVNDQEAHFLRTGQQSRLHDLLERAKEAALQANKAENRLSHSIISVTHNGSLLATLRKTEKPMGDLGYELERVISRD